jgi:hypothetical protein
VRAGDAIGNGESHDAGSDDEHIHGFHAIAIIPPGKAPR